MSNRKIILGVILIIVGLAFLAQTFDLIWFSFGDFMGMLFPLGLIILGIWLMARRRGVDQAESVEAEYKRSDQSIPKPPPPRSEPSAIRQYGTPDEPIKPPEFESHHEEPRVSQSPSGHSSGKTQYSKFIGDMLIDCDGIELQSVEINNFLGDVEIKLHGGKLLPGLNRMIISGFIGDVRILVPQGMAVFAQSSNFIGDIEMMGRRSSGFGNSLDAQTPNYTDAEAKLYVASNHFIGDVHVYVV